MSLPTNPLGAYWPYWNPTARLVDLSTSYNVIFLFHATPVGGPPGTTGAVVYNRPSGTIGTNLNADITTCRARGQRIILTVGGMNAQITINTQARADAFIQSIKDTNVLLGGSGTTNVIDGLDWNNFEGAAITGQATWMTYASQQLKNYYGSDFLITAPPAAFDLNTNGQGGSDRLLLATMYAGGALDWFCPQFYDGLNQLTSVRNALDFYNTAVTVNGASVQIPRTMIGIGFGIQTPTWTDSGYWTIANAISAYNTMVSEGKTPKGGFNWAISLDPTGIFPANMSSVFTNNVEPLSPKFALSASTNFTNGAATTAQLTAPSGKTSGADFQAGTINETSNPTAALDLGSGKYTEIEWCIKATDDAVAAAQYEFRVTYDGVSLDTYSVTPKWTIGTPVAESPTGGGATTGVSSITGITSITI